ncbi:MAG TPA: beta-hydroxyacyl-ACP dehydratase [Rugosimonospora sp.]|nr:beta-hydroxyacyl-ACP dehydratase [Rugosimonospora sp.]
MTDLSGVLPHRPPMLLLDAVVDVHPGRGLTGVLAVPPGGGEVPPYLLLESWLQAAAVLLGLDGAGAGRLPLVGAVRDVRFGRAALPGETVAHRVELVRAVHATAICTGSSAVGGQPVLRVGQATLVAQEHPPAAGHG